ncbi:hypothetical protein N7492_003127 [Penicillium capsulatum]|uniref:Dienelactone hydrolase n=1 Tax=Penicillium capsulatum TaxID=69766 RepID=A0A9W9LX28_9EURO|nr:hypothetical protein N7492_003127 [Penicillium capsulatum]KAJ6122283.1 hypothetical protein N7512_004748 [Penicillium capsulatum]
MVNFFSRFTRRSSSSGGAIPDSGSDNLGSHSLHRTTSATSSKRGRRRHHPAEEASPRHLLLISDTTEFDARITRRFDVEGFDVTYIPFQCSSDPERDRKALQNAIHAKEDELETGERYAIVAYNRPAYYLLVAHHLTGSNTNPFPRLCALITYYPLPSTDIPTANDPNSPRESCSPACSDTSTIFEPGPSATFLPIQIHLPGNNRKACTFWPWISLSASEGDVTYKKRHRCHVYAYPETSAGFAERNSAQIAKGIESDFDDNDLVSSQLAWSRTLGCLRRAFGAGSNWAVVNIETVWEEYWERLLSELDGVKRQSSPTAVPGLAIEILAGKDNNLDEEGLAVECLPTKAGGTTPSSLKDFFKQTFIPNGPASQHIRLLSRTVGADRIVDEISFSFCHTAEVPWLLPGVPPTNRDIKVVVVIIASFMADRIVSQSLYWDQADVLVQAGILDPGLAPRMA